MPKFTDHEKEAIFETLLTKGKELFTAYGLKKTSLDMIVDACGIAKGSFYKFFDSKEELYFRILEREEAFRDAMLVDLQSSELPAREALRQMLKASFDHIAGNPFLLQLHERDEYEMLIRKLPKEMLAEHIQKDNAAAMAWITDWQRRGLLIQRSPEVIVGAIRSLVLLSLHQKEIGKELGAEVMDLLIEATADRLTRTY
ncbi:TetR/AcrR family transcriptional regulator [Tumebacillus sp. DT12]|uniref:TetR/AcrR family transcriptional regulator n=1 Tax=Tumebacillus lacus TaxID=2995335 RepID=A0ABT3X2T0_9BACL|nr:TetR/AcrR family transcriptional regulator [Tumebacillus lacus]MCX7570761.1 TetR/AcrR family transcriptional regulator [Tumebacillus lacus]